MNTYLFPGQGSQSKGMGSLLFDKYNEYAQLAEEILGYSISELCLKDPDDQLGQTQFTQPALFVVNALSYFDKLEQAPQPPDFLAGHSLGEYNALLAAGAFDFKQGLHMVRERGRLMSQAKGGSMAAVMGMSAKHLEDTFLGNDLRDVYIANYNSPNQIVVSGESDQMTRLRTILKTVSRAKCIPLKVSGAFHSPLMQPAKDEFENFLTQFEFSTLQIPVISNVTAKPYANDQIAKLLSDQMVRSVRWTDSIHYLIAQGDMQFEEIGPGKVLSRLLKSISEP